MGRASHGVEAAWGIEESRQPVSEANSLKASCIRG